MSQIDDFLNDGPQPQGGSQPAREPDAVAKPKSQVDAFLADAPAPDRGLGGFARDAAAWAVKGAIAVPEAIVGLADIPTGGRVGKALENEGGTFGFRPKQAREIVNEWHSDATKEAQRKFQEAEGLGGKFQAAIENPSNIAGAVIESLPAMGAGGVIGRGALAATRLGQMGSKGAVVAGALGEGAVMAGSQAEGIRQETDDGLLTPGQAGAALATGAIGAGLGYAGGKLANKLGVGNAETMLAQGTKGLAKQHADEAVAAAANPLMVQAAKGIPRQVIEGALVEGVFEELPQSVTETIIQNLALDKPWSEGLDEAIVLGVLSGGAMGGAAAGYKGFAAPQADTSSSNTAKQAADKAAQEQDARKADALQRVQQAWQQQAQLLAEQEAGEPEVPQTAPPDAAAMLAQQRAQEAQARQAEIDAGRAMASPDDEIYESTGTTMRPSEAMGLNPTAGGLEGAAALAVDAGASAVVQAAAQYIDPDDMPDAGADAPLSAASAVADTAPEDPFAGYERDYDELSDLEKELYDWEMTQREAPDEAFAALAELDDSDIPFFDRASNATDEDFLRALGASDEEIADALTTANQSASTQSHAASTAETQTNEPRGPRQSAGQGQDAEQVIQQQLLPTDPAARIAELEAIAKDADAQARDWASRTYKHNPKPLPEHEAKGGPADVGEANEQRRLKAIADAKQRAAEARAEITRLQEQGNTQAQLAAKAPSVADLAAISRKQIPDMTDAELVALASATSPEHGRFKKLQKALQNRGLQAQAATNKGATENGTQASQTQQAGTQQQQAGAAVGQAIDSVPAGAAAQAAGQSTVTATQKTGNDGAQAAAQGEAVAKAIAQEGNARREAERQRKLEASERWTRMTAAERQAAAANAKGLNAIQKKNVHTKPWADLSDKVRAALLDVVAPIEQTTTQNEAPSAIAKSNSELNHPETVGQQANVAIKNNEVAAKKRMSVWDEATQDDNAVALNRMQELVDSGRMELAEANATVERAIRASDIARDKGLVADYLEEVVARKTGAPYNYASTIEPFEGLYDMGLREARAEYAKRMAERDAQISALPIRKDLTSLDWGEPLTKARAALTGKSAAPEHQQVGVDDREAPAVGREVVSTSGEAQQAQVPEFASFEAKTALLRTSPDLTDANGNLNERGKKIARTPWGELSQQEREVVVGLSESRRKANDSYNAKVREQEFQIERRRLQGERAIQQANGKPFKNEASAKAKLDEFDLADTHAIQKVDGGFVLRQIPPAEQAEVRRKAEGRESYMEAQSAVLAEMGIGENAEGEIDATEEQWAEIERRTAVRLGQKPRESQQVAGDFLPEGWVKIVNGYTKRPVYRMEQGGGQPFAVVTQVEGMQYEVQIRHGDKQLIVSNQTGALSEVLAKAEAELTRMTQANSVTHQDPGEKAEAATPGVVTDSLKKAARNEDTKPSEMRKWLLAEIDKELLQAPDRQEYDEAVKRLGEKDAISAYTGNGPLGRGKETGFVTFDVPGDGKFKVRNSVRGLLEFRKNVSTSAGFKDGGQKRASPPASDGVQGGSGGRLTAITNMIAEGDFEAARDYAEAVGVNLADVKVPKGDRKSQWEKFLKDGTLPQPPRVASSEWAISTEQNANGTRSRVGVLKRTADGSEYVATVRGGIDGTGANYVITKDGKEIGKLTSRVPFSSALEMAEEAMPAANAQEASEGPERFIKVAAEEAPQSVPEKAKAAKAKKEAQASQSRLDRHNAVEAGLRDGSLKSEEYKAAFADLVDNADAVKAEMSKLTVDQLLRAGGPYFAARYKGEKKARIVDAAYERMLEIYALGRSYGTNSWSMGQYAAYRAKQEQALRELVNATTQADIDAYATKVQERANELKAQAEARQRAVANPQTLEDFHTAINARMKEGKTRDEAYRDLTPEQRIRYDELSAEQTRERREALKAQTRAQVATAGSTTANEVIATKHTRDGHDLFVVRLADRVERDAYNILNASAKKLGGHYSSYRGNGAIPGFQFRTREAAEAFRKLVAGDTSEAQAMAQERRDAFADDKSQSAAERLREMADALETRADAALNADRKANTARRARMASAAEAAARQDKALAGTMRNVAEAIESGKAKFLDAVRQKVQVEYLNSVLHTAKDAQIRAKYPSYNEQEKHRGEPIDAETVDYARFPEFTMFRSDLAGVARQLAEVNGGKKLAAAFERVANDVTDAYIEWAKANIDGVSHFSRKSTGAAATFASKADAEMAIRRSGLVGKAIVLPVKRGENRIVLSPSEAMQRGLWQGDGDKLINLRMDVVEQMAELAKRSGPGRDGFKLPWQLENALQARKRLRAMGIETPAEFRSALREFASLQEAIGTPDRIKQMERAMVGRQNDGLDFFPTSGAVVEQMLEAADIQEGMAVLEPSAGMGHIADAIRERTGVAADAVELSPSRRELLEAKGYELVGQDFLDLKEGSYDRIVMNPPFSHGRDIQHVQHAYSLLKPGGRIVAIMGESAFFNSNKRAEAFRDWLESVGGTSEKLPEGSFMDPSLPVNTAASARMVVIEKPEGDAATGNNSNFDPANPDIANFAANPARRPGSAQDKAVMQAIADGKSARDVLRLVANGSKDPFLRQVARMLLKAGITPNIQFGHIGKSAKGDPIHGQYRGKSDTIAIAGSAEYAAERIFMHEAMHAATMRALKKPGLPKLQLQKLLEHVRKQGGAAGFYGLTNVDEFVAEVFTNPDFQNALRTMRAPAGSPLKSAWHSFVQVLRRILGLGDNSTSVLSQALELGVEAVRADMVLRRQGARAAGSVNAGADTIDQTQTEAFKRWFGDSKVVDANGKPLVVYHGTGGDFSTFSSEKLGSNTGAASAKRGFFFASNPKVSDFYSRMAFEDLVGKIKDEFSRALKEKPVGGKWVGGYEGDFVLDSDPDAGRAYKERVLRAREAFLQLDKNKARYTRINRRILEISHEVLDDYRIHIADAKKADQQFLEENPYFSSLVDEYKGLELERNELLMSFGRMHGANVMPVFLKIENPLTHDFEGKQYRDVTYNDLIKQAQEQGRDGVILKNTFDTSDHPKDRPMTDIYVVFEPTQIKSATGNNGNFDPDDPDILNFGTDDLNALKTRAVQAAHNALTHPGKVSLWDKTVGTMRHIAERYPAFKPVFDAAQQFLDDVASVANEAADMAPRLIPRVDTMRDMLKKPISVADNRAIGKALFSGTLDWGRDQHGKAMPMNELRAKYANLSVDTKSEILMASGKVQPQVIAMWRGKELAQYETLINNKFESTILKSGVRFSHEELRKFFNLNEQQISLYDEARATVDKSLDLTARAEMLRKLGRDWDFMRDMVMDAPTLTEAWKLLHEELEQRAKEIPDSRDQMAAKMFEIRSSFDKAQELMEHGYMPLQRFGKYTVDVVDENGERVYFSMFESKAESNKMAQAMRREYPNARVVQGTMNDQQFKLFAGITPETAELFGSMLGLDADGQDAKDQAFQEYLKLAKNNHSALKRLIHRKGIAGYSEDVGRVLASFVYSNARLAATGLNAGKMEQAINTLQTEHKEQGELGEIAAKLRSYIQDPQEEGHVIRGMLFAQYLGGSVASAAVNMTQPFAVTLPWLTQYGGMAAAGRYLAGALRDMAKRGHKYEADLAHALKMAEDDGVVSPQEIHQLMAQARGAGGLRTGDGTKLGDARAQAANLWEKVKVGWGQPFALAEQFNRRSTFIAAYRLAKNRKLGNPAEFARRAVLETQFLYSKANKPQWARGAVGGTLFTFKTYSVSFLELMHRMWTQGGPEGKRAVGWAMAMLLLMGGAGGLPFMEDLEDLIDGAGQMMGYNVSAKQWRQQLLRDVLGAELAGFIEQGMSGLPGAPVDVSGRLGMGNLIPGTGLLLDKQSNARDVVELLGPAGDLVQRGMQAVKSVASGVVNADPTSIGRGVMEVMPTAVRNAAKGVDMASSGIYKDTKGYKVIDTTLDEAVAKFLGFQPRSVAEVQEANSFMQRAKSFYIQTSNEIKAQWAKALFEKDAAGVERARQRVKEWNEKNPDQPIRVNMRAIWERVRQMGKDRTARIADTAPKALRQQLRDMAQEQSR